MHGCLAEIYQRLKIGATFVQMKCMLPFATIFHCGILYFIIPLLLLFANFKLNCSCCRTTMKHALHCVIHIPCIGSMAGIVGIYSVYANY